MREITYSPPTSYCSIAGKSILEDSEPLGQWGLLHSTVPSVGSPTQPHRNNFSAQTFQDSNIVSSDSVRISSSVSTGRIAREPPTRAGSSVTAIPRSQKIRSLNKDVPDDILRHSLFQMMPLDEDAEPQNESSNNNNNNSNSNNNSKINRAALVESSSDHTHMNANIISEPVIEPEPSVVEIPYIPLDVAYKRSLVESAIVFARPGNKKKRTRTGIDAVNEVEAAASKGSVIQLRMMVEEPALCFLPLESGSVCVGCVSEGDMLKSVHVPCAFSLLCGYCLMPFDSNKASDNRGLDNGKYDKKRKSSGIDEEYSFETAIQKVSWEVGVVSYEVHRSCAFYSRRAEMETVAQQDDEDADDIDDLEEKTSRNEITPQVGMNLGSDYIKLGRFHSYGEPDDAGCDLCGRTGGVVQYFTIDSSRSSLPPPRADGWLAHLPCINWLAKNRWLDMAATVSVDGADSSSEQSPLSSSSSSVQQQPQQQDYKSMFDCNFTAWRCILCSSQDGVTVRCCGVACTVRAHPLCIMHAGTPWQLVSGYIADASDSDKSHPKVSVPLFRCKVHSGLDSVCVS